MVERTEMHAVVSNAAVVVHDFAVVRSAAKLLEQVLGLPMKTLAVDCEREALKHQNPNRIGHQVFPRR